jgi:hypothetical protein
VNIGRNVFLVMFHAVALDVSSITDKGKQLYINFKTLKGFLTFKNILT